MFLFKVLCLRVFNLICLFFDIFDGFVDGLDNVCSSCLYGCLYVLKLIKNICKWKWSDLNLFGLVRNFFLFILVIKS